MTMMTMSTTVVSMSPSEKSSAFHSWPRLLSSLDLDDAFGAVDSNVDLARTRILSPPYPLPFSLLLFLLLLGSPSEIQEFALSNHLFPLLVAVS